MRPPKHLIALVLGLCTTLYAEDTFKPLSNPSSELNSESNTGEWFRPDLGTAAEILPLKTRVFATKEAVTDGVGMRWVFEKGSKGVFAFETKADFETGTAGITFYAKASKPLKFRICKNVNLEVKKTSEIGTEWKKYDWSWDDLGGAKEWWQIVFQVIGPIDEKETLYLDRVGVEGPAFIASPKITPTTGADATFSSKDMLYGSENLAKTLANLKAKKPFKILALGDSISAGAQTNRGTWGIEIKKGVTYRYYGQVAREWEQEFGYTGITPVDVAHGGWTTQQLMAITEKELLSQCGPDDLVIIQSGGNDVMGGSTPETWKADVKKLIAMVKTKTDQILVVDTTVTSSGKVLAVAPGLSKALKEITEEEKVAGADVTKFMTYRGPSFACAILANDYHPDYMGHITIGEMIAPILTGKHVVYPNE